MADFFRIAKATSILILTFLFSAVLIDALDVPPIPPDQLNASYFNESRFNGITYTISASEIIVEVPVNGTYCNITSAFKVPYFTLTGKDTRANFTTTEVFWRGDYIYTINFDRPVDGKLQFQLPGQGQRFIAPIVTTGPVRVILPEGYTTGNRILGAALPQPDAVLHNDTVLIWNSSQNRIIQVGYYKTQAFESIQDIFILIAAVALYLAADYYISIRRLRESRKIQEDKWKDRH